MKPDKCDLLKKEVQYVEHCVSIARISPDLDKVKCVQDWAIPKTVKQLQSSQGLAVYYYRFVKDFARIVKPLNELLSPK